MRKYTRSILLLALTNVGLVSCSGSDEEITSSVGTAGENLEAAVVVNQNGPQDANDGGNNNSGNNGPQNQIPTRSPQGIQGDGDRRRQNARDRRRDNANQAQVETTAQGREVRSYDGSNNNQTNNNWGAAFSHLQRIAPAAYTDGVSTLAGQTRANARAISNALASQGPGESIPNRAGASDFSWQWGQFLDHDINLTDGSDFEAANIEVPAGDLWFDPNATGDVLIPFNRGLFDPDTGTDPGNPREQENEITSWIDGSMVYGSSTERLNELRVGPDNAFLKTSQGNLLPFNVNQVTNANGFITAPESLFLAGDIRANEQVGLAAMHTLFVREHNRLASQLQQQMPQANGQEIFEAARRLVVAKIQIITYDEHLPALMGTNALSDYTGYSANVDGTIFNEFSAAAYRLGHSMVNDDILRLNANGSTIGAGNLSLREAFFAAPRILASENDIDPILRGLAAQRHQRVDVQTVDTLRNFLFGQPGSGGFDLIALNIQRGRDHGLPSYNDAREAVGLPRYNSIAQITSDDGVVEDLESIYTSIEDIDLWVGGLAEDPVRGSQLGPLFQAIMIRQFVALRDGDRFWYQNYLTDDELAMVRGTTLASVIRANTNIGNELQDNVFYVNE